VDVTGSALYLLETKITAYIVSGRSPSAREMLKQTLQHAAVAISTITEAEILFGLELKPEAARLRASVEALFQAVEIRCWDSAAAHAYGRLRGRLKTVGKSLAEMDLLIASHALATGAVLVSHDKAFQHVTPFLTVVDWATDLQGSTSPKPAE
jgi:tRNA(fMet)-specific endonuclease VapC